MSTRETISVNHKRKSVKKKLFKRCHICDHVIESDREIEKCPNCKKAFLPLNYFNKVNDADKTPFQDLFSETDDLYEEDLIKGIYVLW